MIKSGGKTEPNHEEPLGVEPLCRCIVGFSNFVRSSLPVFHDTGGYPQEYPHDILVMVDFRSQLPIMIPEFQGIVGEPYQIYIQNMPKNVPLNHHVCCSHPIESPCLLLNLITTRLPFCFFNSMKSQMVVGKIP